MRQSRMSRFTRMRRWPRFGALLALTLAAGVGHAQSTSADAGDPPDRVARLAYLAGDVGFLPAGASDWSDASLNRPLTRGDRLAAAGNARAELELDHASLRLDRDTDVGVLQLDDRLAQLELTRGTLNLSVRSLDPDESYEIDTPNVALVVSSPGVFRIDVDDRAGTTKITALEGQATVYGEGDASRRVIGGHRYRFDDSSLAQVAESYAGSQDAFDRWCADRDARYARAGSRRYVSEDVIGYEDLDHYGRWQSDDAYGQVWYPAYVASDWAPYRDGHWAYVAPWGWTWIDDAPWGFAPYHYGRWVYVRDRWGWIPGPRELRAVYAPALVAFVGGSGWRVSIGTGVPIGWFPLGPGDFYNPWYRVSADYYRRINRHNLRWDRHHGDRDGFERYFHERYRRYREGRDPHEHYANRLAPHGITAMSRDAFVQARRVEGHRLRIDPQHLRTAPVLGRGVQVAPVRASYAGMRTERGRAAPEGRFDRPVVSHRAPPAMANRANDARGEHATPAGDLASRFPMVRGHPDAATAERTMAMPSSRFVRGRQVPDEAGAMPARRIEAGPATVNARRFPQARGRPDAATAERTMAMPSSRFVRGRSGPDESNVPPARGGTLPAVQRFVRATQLPPATPAPTPNYRYAEPREAQQRGTLPAPLRFAPAGNRAAPAWRAPQGEPQVVRVPGPQPREPAMPRRFEPRFEPRQAPMPPAPRPMVQAPREAMPAPQPMPRRFEAPAPRAAPPAQSEPRRVAPRKNDDHSHPGAARFQQR
ncbi:DUF6600 domain-containing protein [Dyella sp. KRB-257]|uniref:DUF6600 domain-containing protein n=1 Tax=Dyella sp. KRB-257 TaxID=3400915 RepID=UPI003BFD4E9A